MISSSALVASSLLLASCASDSTPKATGADPALILQVDCGDGVANLSVTYGTAATKKYLIGNSPQADVAKFDSDYGTAPGFPEATLTAEVSPTRGTCTTTLTDRESGKVLTKKETAGTAKVTGIVPAMK